MTSAPEWDDFRLFLEVLRGGGYAAGALEAGVVAATARRAVERLEAALGGPLVEGETRALRPTGLGEEIRALAEAMERDALAFEEDAAAERDETRGEVRLLTSDVVATWVLPPMVAELRRRHPGLRIRVLSQDALDSLDPADADIALHYQPIRKGMTAVRLGVMRMGFFGREGLLDHQPRPRTPADLERAPLIGLKDPARFRMLTEPLSPGWTPTPTVQTDTVAEQWAAVLAGLGFGLGQVALGAREPGLFRAVPELEGVFPVWLSVQETSRDLKRVRLVEEGLLAVLARHLGEDFYDPRRDRRRGSPP